MNQHTMNPSLKPGLLTVLIPNYNYGRYIGEAIASVAAQDYPDIELIVVDDGSSDDSLAAIARALAATPRFAAAKVLALKPNGGKLAAINAALGDIHGEYLITLDADDRLTPNYAARCIAELTALRRADPHIGIIYSDCLLIDSAGQVIDRGRSTDFDVELLQNNSYIPEPALVITAAFLEVTPFDTTIKVGTKHHKWRRMVANGWHGRHIAEPLFHYRMHDRNISGIGNRVYEEIAQGRPGGERLLSGYWVTARS